MTHGDRVRVVASRRCDAVDVVHRQAAPTPSRVAITATWYHSPWDSPPHRPEKYCEVSGLRLGRWQSHGLPLPIDDLDPPRQHTTDEFDRQIVSLLRIRTI